MSADSKTAPNNARTRGGYFFDSLTSFARLISSKSFMRFFKVEMDLLTLVSGICLISLKLSRI